jgi:hypothetical protein
MELIVRQYGGIGNQLFQYVIGRYYAKKYGAALRIVTDTPARAVSYGHPRPPLLSNFAIAAQVEQISTFERLFLSLSAPLELVTRPFRYIARIQVIREVQPQPFTFSPDLHLDERTRRLYLVGLWQCCPPVQLMESELRSELSFRHQPRGQSVETARQIRAARKSVSLHLRRGDYLAHFGSDFVLTNEYYVKAMAQMRNRLGKTTFFVFSDDQEFASQFVLNNPDCALVSHNNKSESAHEDLRLMSLCENHIIANSTFSWWGAWLNCRTTKYVIAPKQWLGVDTTTIELYPPNWVRI